METRGSRRGVASAVREEMERAGTDAPTLARRTGLKRSALEGALRAEIPFTLDELAVIANELRVDVSTFFPSAGLRGAPAPNQQRAIRPERKE